METKEYQNGGHFGIRYIKTFSINFLTNRPPLINFFCFTVWQVREHERSVERLRQQYEDCLQDVRT